ncbi:MAG TPA: amidohydrolase family protein [Actinomycetota bacterium]|nr:amidohydrolase family protein [Actinomycetota bacterium]
MTRTHIRDLEFVVMVDKQGTVLRGATVVLDGPRIADIGPASEVARRAPVLDDDVVVDGHRLGMIPGLIDTHVHLSETLARGLFPDNLSTRPWVFHWAKPFYAHVGADDEEISVLLGTAEMLRSGTTCFLDMGAQNDPGITARAAATVGMRGIVGRHAADRKPDEIPAGWSEEMLEHHFFPDAPTALAELRACVERWNGHDDGRIRCWVNIEGKEPCSPELHIGARELAEELGVGTTYHIATSIEEAEGSERRYGMWPITRIGRMDGLGSNLVLAHAVAATDTEVALLAENDTKVAFCPATSLKLAKGATAIGKYPEMLKRGVTVGLGTDGVAAAGTLNLLRQVYLTAGLFKDARLDAGQVGAERALRMGTIDAAKAIGWDDEIGSLEPGKRADLVLFKLDHFEWTPYTDPVQALVWSVTSASIAQTWVDGRQVYADDRVRGVDEATLRAEARTRAAAVAERAGLLQTGVPTTTKLYES